MEWQEQQSLLHQHGNINFVYPRGPNLPTIEVYKREGHRFDLLVALLCAFALGVVTGMAL